MRLSTWFETKTPEAEAPGVLVTKLLDVACAIRQSPLTAAPNPHAVAHLFGEPARSLNLGRLLSAGPLSPILAMLESAKRKRCRFWSTHVVIVQQGSAMTETYDREQGSMFQPRFDAIGLLTAVAVDAESREILMLAHMDAEALAKTRETGLAHFHSRSRGRLWMKGESSGHVLQVEQIRVDCDQDALVLIVRPAGPACHTGATSCFYRALDGDSLVRIDD